MAWDLVAVGLPRSRGLTTLGVHDHLVVWLHPKPGPSWLTWEMGAALPKSLIRREGRYPINTPGLRACQVPLGTTLRDATV